jgi:hypothetical protein
VRLRRVEILGGIRRAGELRGGDGYFHCGILVIAQAWVGNSEV